MKAPGESTSLFMTTFGVRGKRIVIKTNSVLKPIFWNNKMASDVPFHLRELAKLDIKITNNVRRTHMSGYWR